MQRGICNAGISVGDTPNTQVWQMGKVIIMIGMHPNDFLMLWDELRCQGKPGGGDSHSCCIQEFFLMLWGCVQGSGKGGSHSCYIREPTQSLVGCPESC